MAYDNFTLADATDRFELNLAGSPFCENLPVAIPSELFSAILSEWLPLAQQARSEKAKSELLISLVLLKVRKLVHNSVELFSGEEFSVDRERGFNDFQGALADYNQAIALDPKYAKAHFNRGVLKNNELNDLKGAISDLQQAAKLDQQQGRQQDAQRAIEIIKVLQASNNNSSL